MGRGRAGGASGACACRFSAGELALIEVPVTSDLAASADLRLERTTAAAIVAGADRALDMLQIVTPRSGTSARGTPSCASAANLTAMP
ncbi:MAG: hypothetical protein KGS47_00890 [Chloroflexi bacterium]|nr:hypothetical protein [Chloroflexota bacterium]